MLGRHARPDRDLEDNVDPGIAFLAELMKKTQPVNRVRFAIAAVDLARVGADRLPAVYGITADGGDRADSVDPRRGGAQSRRQLVPDLPPHHPAVEHARPDL